MPKKDGDMEDEFKTNPGLRLSWINPSAPISPESGCVVIIYGDDLGKRIPMDGDEMFIGRGFKCDIVIDQESISRTHAVIRKSGKRYTLQDLGSTNGTFVNDVAISSIELRDGDQIKVGRTIFKFILGGNMEAQYHEEIYRMMTIDALTGLHNRRFFYESFEKEFSRSKRYGRIFSLLLLDIDHFKQINDRYGHLTGDHVLRVFGGILRSLLRRDDFAARTGGEEFAVVLPEVSQTGALAVAEKIRTSIEASDINFDGVLFRITVCIGVSSYNPTLDSADTMFKACDALLYEAKHQGRNRVAS